MFKEENAALGLKYTASALSHANLRACTHFITQHPFESSPGGPRREIPSVALFARDSWKSDARSSILALHFPSFRNGIHCQLYFHPLRPITVLESRVPSGKSGGS